MNYQSQNNFGARGRNEIGFNSNNQNRIGGPYQGQQQSQQQQQQQQQQQFPSQIKQQNNNFDSNDNILHDLIGDEDFQDNFLSNQAPPSPLILNNQQNINQREQGIVNGLLQPQNVQPQNYNSSIPYPDNNQIRIRGTSTNSNINSASINSNIVLNGQFSQNTDGLKSVSDLLAIKNEQIKQQFIQTYIKDIATNTYKKGIVKKKYQDNSSYFGQTNAKNVNEGKGIYQITNGDLYLGQFRDGKFSGDGVYIHYNMERYEGDFQFGKKNGKGVYFYNNGDVYTGDWENNVRSGHGVKFSYATNDEYEGFYKNGLKNGLGSIQYGNGDHYTGDFINDIKEGKGKMVYSDKTVYVGEFKNNLPNGKGQLEIVNGEYFDGIVKDGTMYQGFLRCENGDQYEGQFFQNQYQGQGEMRYANNSVYTGQWVNGKKEGNGVFVNDQYKYTGQFKNDLFHGQGTCQYYNNDSYKGEWENGVKVYGFQYVDADRCTYEGYFKGFQRHGRGVMVWLDFNNDTYDGEWFEDLKHGKGQFTYTDEFGQVIVEDVMYDMDQKL